MSGKAHLIDDLRRVFVTWERFVGGLAPADLTARPPSGKWSVAEVVTHLEGWLQLSNARLDAALRSAEPDLPAWLGGADPFYAEDHVNEFNARIQQLHRDEPWPARYQAWRQGVERFLALCEELPESLLFDSGRFAWLRGNPLSAVLDGAREHHEEHFDRVQAERGGA